VKKWLVLKFFRSEYQAEKKVLVKIPFCFNTHKNKLPDISLPPKSILTLQKNLAHLRIIIQSTGKLERFGLHTHEIFNVTEKVQTGMKSVPIEYMHTVERKACDVLETNPGNKTVTAVNKHLKWKSLELQKR
jgi:hypothetical protein